MKRQKIYTIAPWFNDYDRELPPNMAEEMNRQMFAPETYEIPKPLIKNKGDFIAGLIVLGVMVGLAVVSLIYLLKGGR